MKIELTYTDDQNTLNVEPTDEELTPALAECVGMLLFFADREMRKHGVGGEIIDGYLDLLFARAKAYVADHRKMEPLDGAN